MGAPAPASSHIGSQEGAPTLFRQGKDTPSLKNVKTNIEENSKNFQSQADGGHKGAHVALKNMKAKSAPYKKQH